MRNGAKAARRLAVVGLALTLIGCADMLGPEEDGLAAARARWTRASIDSYVFEFQRSCFCVPDFVRPVRIEILEGLVDSAVYVDTEEPVSPPLTSVPTIEDLFDEIQEAFDRMGFFRHGRLRRRRGIPYQRLDRFHRKCDRR